MRNYWKGLVVGLAAALAVACSNSAALANATCGDLDASGGRSLADVILLFRAVLENPDPPNLCGSAAQGALQCGDTNADGAIGLGDVVLLFQNVLGIETLFPLCTGPGTAVACPGGTADINGDITTNQIWPSTCTIRLNTLVFVQAGVVLTIEPGTTIKGNPNPTPKPGQSGAPVAALVFLRDSKINAQGTETDPIVFTCDKTAGQRGPGCWGGLVLNGRSTVNTPGGENLAEGLTNVPFGGAEPTDSSGILQYVRVEFAGRILSTDNELNVVTHNAIGSGTIEDHIEANQGLDDGLEWFGGTGKMKFMVSFGAADDNFDWQLGTSTALQYGYAHQYGPILQNSGNHGFEGDNNENALDALPRSKPKYCNMTLIGAKGQSQAGAQESYGALLRRGTSGNLAKTIVMNFKTGGMRMNDAATALNACTAGPALTNNLLWRDSIFFGNGPNGVEHAILGVLGSNCDSYSLYHLWATNGAVAVKPDLGTCSGGGNNGARCENTSECPGGVCNNPAAIDPGISVTYPNLDPRPTNGAAVTSTAVNCSSLDSSFDNTDYIGAFDPNGANWLTTPWISAAIN